LNTPIDLHKFPFDYNYSFHKYINFYNLKKIKKIKIK
jgi:hypothetical protein